MALRLLKNTTRPKSLLLLTDIAGLIAIGAAAFAATNIDDIFVLMVLFSTSFVASLTFPVRHVVLGQYLGISLLIAISALGSLIPLLVPPYFIGLLGIVPMAIGARRLVQIIRKDGNTSIISAKEVQLHKQTLSSFFGSSCYNLFKRWGQHWDLYSFVRTV